MLLGVDDKRRKILTLQALFLCLPDVNRRCLRLVLSLLYSVARSQDDNKMTATSLATIFLPTLLPQGDLVYSYLKPNVA